MLLHNNTCISVCGCRRRRNAKKTRGITILANVRLNTQRCTVTTKHNHDNMFVVVAKYNKILHLTFAFGLPSDSDNFAGYVKSVGDDLFVERPDQSEMSTEVTWPALRQSQLTWPSARDSRSRSCWSGSPPHRRPGAGPGCRGNTWRRLPCLCKGQAPSLSRVTCGHVMHVAVGCSWIVIIQIK